jgi:hypothetical protein
MEASQFGDLLKSQEGFKDLPPHFTNNKKEWCLMDYARTASRALTVYVPPHQVLCLTTISNQPPIIQSCSQTAQAVLRSTFEAPFLLHRCEMILPLNETGIVADILVPTGALHGITGFCISPQATEKIDFNGSPEYTDIMVHSRHLSDGEERQKIKKISTLLGVAGNPETLQAGSVLWTPGPPFYRNTFQTGALSLTASACIRAMKWPLLEAMQLALEHQKVLSP